MDERLKDIVSLSEAMLKAAQNTEWETVAGLELERREKIALAFEPSAEGAIPKPELAHAAQTVLALDKELIALGERARDGVLENLRKLQRGKNATGAYGAQPG
jgi:hypothetical protein